MSKLSGVKAFTIGGIAFLSVTTILVGNALAQDNQKPASQNQQKPEQSSGCCCKKMMSGTTHQMPGMDHSTPSGK